MATVYLETSFFSACVTSRNSAQALGWKASSNLWLRDEAPKHQLYISDEVIEELINPEFRNSADALKLLQGLTVLEINTEVRKLAEVLVHERIMPAPAVSGDAIHVAVATIHRISYVLSWNVRHLANESKRTHLAVICMRLGLTPPLIYTPDML